MEVTAYLNMSAPALSNDGDEANKDFVFAYWYLLNTDGRPLTDKNGDVIQFANENEIKAYMFSGTWPAYLTTKNLVPATVTNPASVADVNAFTFQAEVVENPEPTAKNIPGTEFYTQATRIAEGNNNAGGNQYIKNFLNASVSEFKAYVAQKEMAYITNISNVPIIAWADRNWNSKNINAVYWWSPLGDISPTDEDELEEFKNSIIDQINFTTISDGQRKDDLNKDVDISMVQYTDSSKLYTSNVRIRNGNGYVPYSRMAIVSITDTSSKYTNPVVLWFVPDGGNITASKTVGNMYCYSPEEHPLVNEDSGTTSESVYNAMFSKWTILESVTGINEWDFSETRSLQNMFYGCTKLNSVTINGDVKNCTSLRNAFRDCTSLTTVKMHAIAIENHRPLRSPWTVTDGFRDIHWLMVSGYPQCHTACSDAN